MKHVAAAGAEGHLLMRLLRSIKDHGAGALYL